jgi:hypothetical protein
VLFASQLSVAGPISECIRSFTVPTKDPRRHRDEVEAALQRIAHRVLVQRDWDGTTIFATRDRRQRQRPTTPRPSVALPHLLPVGGDIVTSRRSLAA